MSASSENIQFCHNDYKGPGVVVSNRGSKSAVAVAEEHYNPRSSVLAITIRDKMGEIKSVALMDPSSCGLIAEDIKSFAIYKNMSAEDLKSQRRRYSTTFYRYVAEAFGVAQHGDTIEVYYMFRNIEAFTHHEQSFFSKISMNPEKTITGIFKEHYPECNCKFSIIPAEENSLHFQDNFALTGEGNFVALEQLSESDQSGKKWQLKEKLDVSLRCCYLHAADGSKLCPKPLSCTDEISRESFTLSG